jgi:hypothetical protein
MGSPSLFDRFRVPGVAPGSRADRLLRAPGEALDFVDENTVDPTEVPSLFAEYGAKGAHGVAQGIESGLRYLNEDDRGDRPAPHAPGPLLAPPAAPQAAPAPDFPNLGAEPMKMPAGKQYPSLFNAPAAPRAPVPERPTAETMAGLAARAYQGPQDLGFGADTRDFLEDNDFHLSVLPGQIKFNRARDDQRVQDILAAQKFRNLYAEGMPAGESPRMRASGGLFGDAMKDVQQDYATTLPTAGEEYKREANRQSLFDKYRGEMERDVAVARATEDAKAAGRYGDDILDSEARAQIEEIEAMAGVPEARKRLAIQNVIKEANDEKRRLRELGLAPNRLDYGEADGRPRPGGA